ncbi:MAG: NfeD family protein [Asticcacaulis sp.]
MPDLSQILNAQTLANLWLMGPMGLQAFWLWLTLGILLLGIEALAGTNWLLWMASVAGVVAVACLTTLPLGLPLQIALFVALSLCLILFSPRILKLPGAKGHIDDPDARMLGREAVVLSGFGPVDGGDRTGRVMFDGVEWPAVVTARGDTLTPLDADDAVVIDGVQDGRLYVKTTHDDPPTSH